MRRSTTAGSYRTMPVYSGGPSGGTFGVLRDGQIDGSKAALDAVSKWVSAEQAFYWTGLYVEQIQQWIKENKVAWRLNRGQHYVRVSEIAGRTPAAGDWENHVLLSSDYKAVYYLPLNEKKKRLDNFDHEMLPEEIGLPALYTEGVQRQICINAYERNRKARAKCIEHYGYECVVCSHNMEELYGDLGAAYIHVHHLKELASIGRTYRLDPIADLRPVCPNCHAMLHARKPALSISELKDRLKARRRKRAIRY